MHLLGHKRGRTHTVARRALARETSSCLHFIASTILLRCTVLLNCMFTARDRTPRCTLPTPIIRRNTLPLTLPPSFTFPCNALAVLDHSYVSLAAWTLFILSAGYLLLTYTRPLYRRWVDGLDYRPISNGGGAARNASGTRRQEGAGGGGGGGDETSAISANPAGPGGVIGRGWRAYGSTDEAPAVAGCLPTSTVTR